MSPTQRLFTAAALALLVSPITTPADQATPLLTARAASLNALGRFPEAIKDATRVLTLDPKNGEANALRGIAWRQSGETAKALVDYRKAYGLGYRAEWMRDFLVGNGVRVGAKR